MHQGKNIDVIVLIGKDDDIGKISHYCSPSFSPEFPPTERLEGQVLNGLIKGLQKYFVQTLLAISIKLKGFLQVLSHIRVNTKAYHPVSS